MYLLSEISVLMHFDLWLTISTSTDSISGTRLTLIGSVLVLKFHKITLIIIKTNLFTYLKDVNNLIKNHFTSLSLQSHHVKL